MKQTIKKLFFSILGPKKGNQILYKIKVKKNLIPMLLRGQIGHIGRGISCEHQWYGEFELGFYVCPKLINKQSIVYSFGIGLDISFENELMKRHGCSIHGFDPTPKSIAWFKSQNISPDFKLHEFGLGTKNEMVTFFLPKNEDHVSGSIVVNNHIDTDRKISVPMKSFSYIQEILKHKKIDLLKMDIEGSEYDVLESILSSQVIIDQLLVEFHARYFEDGKEKTEKMIQLLKANGFEVFGVSDSYEEVSFIRKDALL